MSWLSPTETLETGLYPLEYLSHTSQPFSAIGGGYVEITVYEDGRHFLVQFEGPAGASGEPPAAAWISLHINAFDYFAPEAMRLNLSCTSELLYENAREAAAESDE